jgi:antitoxin VapB
MMPPRRFMTTTRIRRYGRTQAIRLPETVAFPDSVRDFVILRDGPRRIIVPADSVWDDYFAEPGIDLPDRVQPPLTGQGMDSAPGTRNE